MADCQTVVQLKGGKYIHYIKQTIFRNKTQIIINSDNLFSSLFAIKADEC